MNYYWNRNDEIEDETETIEGPCGYDDQGNPTVKVGDIVTVLVALSTEDGPISYRGKIAVGERVRVIEVVNLNESSYYPGIDDLKTFATVTVRSQNNVRSYVSPFEIKKA
jgi:hypothetical protein